MARWMVRWFLGALITLGLGGFGAVGSVRGGIYLAKETWNDLPSQWRGFLLDHRQLIRIGMVPPGQKPSPSYLAYREAVRTLKEKRKTAPLTAEESAELGGLLLRIGQPEEALTVLQNAQKVHLGHFRLTAHTSMGWALLGQWEQAWILQKEAVRLAPGKWLPHEETLEALFSQRARRGPNAPLEDLFGVNWDSLGESIRKGQPWPGLERLGSDTLARAQALALWLPSDGWVLAQVAAVCAAYGDAKQAGLILDGVVTEFGVRDPKVLRLRLACKDFPPANHGKHPTPRFRSARPFEDSSEMGPLPVIEPGKPTEVPWIVFGKTKPGKMRSPEFPGYLKQLDGSEVILDGYLQPFGENLDEGRFLLVENSVGCWWCDMPDLTGMIRVELAENELLPGLRRLVRVQGKLVLNSTDPESHFFFLEKSRVKPLD